MDSLTDRISQLESRIESLSNKTSHVIPITTLTPEPFDLLKEIKAVVSPSDDEFIASFYDANVSAQGCNEQEAIDNLKSAIVSQFNILEGYPPEKVGPYLKKQLAILRTFIRRRS